MVTFSNPAGFFALLAIPAILAIHYLQRESRRLIISTLFLLDNVPPETTQGRRFQELRNSVPLWLQILAAILIAWLLAQPRWLRRDSVQRIVLVLDSSVSMSAFRPELKHALDERTASLAKLAATTEWQLMESDTTRPILYAGTERGRLLDAAATWQPQLGTHEIFPALELARTHLHGTGSLIFVTDRPTLLPEGAHLLAVGHHLENCGFTGVTFTGRTWKALVKNYGDLRQERKWWIEANGQSSPPQTLTLEPGETHTLSADLPEGVTASELHLTPDAFAIDDRLPLVLPVPKPFALALQGAADFTAFMERFAGTVENSTLDLEKPDLRLVTYDPLRPALPAGAAIVFNTDPSTAGKLLGGEPVPENHPLMEGLNFSGLLCRSALQIPAQAGDETLLWLGERPLLYLRQTEGTNLLVVNFDLRGSNATRLPDFIILLHRFAERLRAAKIAPETRDVETNQLLAVASDPALPAPTLAGQPATPLRAPAQPGFFEVAQDGHALLTAAAQFSDSREADFRDAGEKEDLSALQAQLLERNTEPDFLTPVWLLALAAAMFVNWNWKTA